MGLTLAELAKRLKITPPAVRSFEMAEAEDRITLGSLRRVAAAMDCELVYALVPHSGKSGPTTETEASKSPTLAEVIPEKVTDLTWHAQRGEM
jgi:transcriptional regulator with XRE-family HTH domain